MCFRLRDRPFCFFAATAHYNVDCRPIVTVVYKVLSILKSSIVYEFRQVYSTAPDHKISCVIQQCVCRSFRFFLEKNALDYVYAVKAHSEVVLLHAVAGHLTVFCIIF